MKRTIGYLLAVMCILRPALADDWPEWRGKGRAGIWNESGKILWTREWDADYQGIGYGSGPRATPTVDVDRVYIVGGSGKLFCLGTHSGNIIWQKDYTKDYGTQMPM